MQKVGAVLSPKFAETERINLTYFYRLTNIGCKLFATSVEVAKIRLGGEGVEESCFFFRAVSIVKTFRPASNLANRVTIPLSIHVDVVCTRAIS